MTSIIIRKDTKTNRPVAFLPSTVNNGQIKAWKPRMSAPEIVGVDYYQSTKAIDNPARAQRVAKMYAKANNETDVIVRERLPRFYANNGGVYKSELQASQAPAKAPKKRAARQPKPTANQAPDVQELAAKLAELLAPMLAK